MKKLLGTTFALLFMAVSGASPDAVTAQSSTLFAPNPCVIVKNDYARTRIGPLCLFRGEWVCGDTTTPIEGCSPYGAPIDSLAD